MGWNRTEMGSLTSGANDCFPGSGARWQPPQTSTDALAGSRPPLKSALRISAAGCLARAAATCFCPGP